MSWFQLPQEKTNRPEDAEWIPGHTRRGRGMRKDANFRAVDPQLTPPTRDPTDHSLSRNSRARVSITRPADYNAVQVVRPVNVKAARLCVVGRTRDCAPRTHVWPRFPVTPVRRIGLIGIAAFQHQHIPPCDSRLQSCLPQKTDFQKWRSSTCLRRSIAHCF